MLMVIFGAGASYDSCSSFPLYKWPRDGTAWHRPPLAKELFLPLDQYRDISKNYRQCQYLFSDLEGRENVEEILERFRLEAETDPQRAQQLLALQYYIRDVVSHSQRAWTTYTRGVSNHQKLLDHARKWSNVCLVTFNYDKLIEDALAGMGLVMSIMESYVSDAKFKLIKLHGSIDWVNLVPSVPGLSGSPTPQALINAAARFGETNIFSVEKHQPPAEFHDRLREPYVELPALAIPTISKSRFICPDSHVEALRQCIPAVTRVLMIGWRATERHFLKMLAEGLRPETQGLAVCGKEDFAESTVGNLKAGDVPGVYYADRGGFSDFVRSPRMAEFLKVPALA